jgi:ATP-dependent Zn protease
MSTPDLSEFDEIGLRITDSSESPTNPEQPATAIPENPVKANEPDNSNSPKESAQNNPPSPKKMVIGCLFFFFILFVILVIAMIFGLSAGESTITSFGLNPASFKNWTIGIVSIFSA